MAPRRPQGYTQAVLAGLLLYTVGGFFSISQAQAPPPTAIKASGLGTAVSNTNGTGVCSGPTCTITGGTRSGNNLFHSLELFSVGRTNGTNHIADFSNTMGGGITNILSRVTGGVRSDIYGTIQTTNFNGANLFLINPAGWIFGPTASLDVGGSFHATTADYIKLGNDGIFYANPSAGTDVLTVSPPSAFGFLSASPASIEVQTGGIDFNTFLPAAVLQVPQGQTLSLVGGNSAGSNSFGVSIGALDGSSPGYVLAPAGRVNLVSVASAGEAAFDGKGFNVDGFTQLGGVKVGSGSIVDGKEIFIRGGRLVIDNGVVVPGAFAFELSFVGLSPLPDGGEVNIKVTDDVTITGTQREFFTVAPPGIFVYTGDPFGFSISPAAKVPDVKIDAGSVSISGLAGIHAQRNADGEAGNVEINANKVTVGSGGSIVLLNTFQGPGPNLTINAKEMDVSGDGSESAFGFEGIAVQGLRHPAYLFLATNPELITADSGNITINASSSLNVSGLAQITTDSRVFGRAGAITINAGDIFLAGTGQFESGVIASQSAFAGDAGNVTINAANTITIKDGFRITSTSLGSGNAGNVDVTAGKSLALSNNGRILGRTNQPPDAALNALFNEVFLQDFDSLRAEMGNPNATMMEVIAYLQGRGDIQIPNLDLTPGDAGRVSVTTPALTLNADASIQTSTGWEGNAGQIVGNVGSLSVDGGSFISSTSGIVLRNPDGTIIGPVVGPGDAGSITLTATDPNTISISGRSPTTGAGSSISTATFGDGDGGNIFLTGNQIYVQNGGSVTSQSGGMLAGQLFAGTGLAGNVDIIAGSLFRMVDGSITTQAVVADGGNISITTTGSTLRLTDSQITTSVQSGVGQGGNITIGSLGHPFEFILLGDSQIRADAFGGPGGNINIFANVYLTSASVVSASSALSTPGTIAIEATVSDVSGSLTQLPTSPLEAAALMRASCAARLAGGKASSLVVAGREGLPLDPSGLLPSPLVEEPPVAALAPNEEFPWLRSLLWVSYLSLDPNCLR